MIKPDNPSFTSSSRESTGMGECAIHDSVADRVWFPHERTRNGGESRNMKSPRFEV